MAKGYVLFVIEMLDADRYVAEYVVKAKPAVLSFGGRTLVNKGALEVVEGDWRPPSIVITEFDSFEQAKAFYHSEAYSEARSYRKELSNAQVVLLEGV